MTTYCKRQFRFISFSHSFVDYGYNTLQVNANFVREKKNSVFKNIQIHVERALINKNGFKNCSLIMFGTRVRVVSKNLFKGKFLFSHGRLHE